MGIIKFNTPSLTPSEVTMTIHVRLYSRTLEETRLGEDVDEYYF